MAVLWSHDDWMTPSEVATRIKRRPQLAYTTVMTILVRLYDKGMLDRQRAGRAYEYRPIAGRDEWAAQRMHEVLSSAGDRSAALGHFVAEISRSEANQLRRLLQRRRR